MGSQRRSSSRCILVVGTCMCIIGLGIGIAIGYFAWPNDPKNEVDVKLPSTIQALKQRCESKCDAAVELVTSCNPSLPRHYVSHKLLPGQSITFDGKLDDEAWKEVPFTENFMDIRGPKYPAAKVETKVKLRYDTENIYVGVWLEEPHVWATMTEQDTRIYKENAFEVFFDVDNSMSMYKEFEINALGTTWDLMLSRAYMDGGDFFPWSGIVHKGVYTDGAVNNASVKATYWSAEIAFSFEALNENTTRDHLTPKDGEMWFMTLARPEYDLEALPNGTYAKKPGTDTTWLSWNPTGAVNLHLPSKWGLLFFEEDGPNAGKPHVDSKRWLTYQALFDVFNALKSRQTILGDFVEDLNFLDIPAYVKSDCLKSVEIKVNGAEFIVTIESKKESGIVGKIDQNRHVVFSQKAT